MTGKSGFVQARNPRIDRYVKIDTTTGSIVSHKKSPGPYSNVPMAKPHKFKERQIRSTKVQLKIKELDPEAKLPTKATEGSACYDVYSNESINIRPHCVELVKTGWAFEVPTGNFLEIRPRSGLAIGGITVANSPGTLDSDYRGELKVILLNTGLADYLVNKGDRIAQVRLVECVDTVLEVVFELSETVRGEGGFGSTGK